jgi:hypothetical protein
VKNGNSDESIEYHNIPMTIEVAIELAESEQVQLSVGRSRPLVLERPRDGQPGWEIAVKNNPDVFSACSGDHFGSYYYALNQVILDPDRYSPMAIGEDPCSRNLHHDKKAAVATRPCIPISMISTTSN